MSEQNRPFFLIWNPQCGAPTVKHWSYEAACREAERLARNNKGQRFIILSSVEAFSINEVVKTDMRPGQADFDGDIPF